MKDKTPVTAWFLDGPERGNHLIVSQLYRVLHVPDKSPRRMMTCHPPVIEYFLRRTIGVDWGHYSIVPRRTIAMPAPPPIPEKYTAMTMADQKRGDFTKWAEDYIKLHGPIPTFQNWHMGVMTQLDARAELSGDLSYATDKLALRDRKGARWEITPNWRWYGNTSVQIFGVRFERDRSRESDLFCYKKWGVSERVMEELIKLAGSACIDSIRTLVRAIGISRASALTPSVKAMLQDLFFDACPTVTRFIDDFVKPKFTQRAIQKAMADLAASARDTRPAAPVPVRS